MKNKNRWVRMKLSAIRKDSELFGELLKKTKKGIRQWPYLCGDDIKWKET